MYLSLRDSPGPTSRAPRKAAAERPVARVVVLLGVVSLLTDISSESVAAILPLYLTAVSGSAPVRSASSTASTRASALWCGSPPAGAPTAGATPSGSR